MRVFRCAHDSQALRGLIVEFYDLISDDDSPPAEEFFPPEGPLYILGAIDDVPASAFIEHGGQIHFMTRRRFRMFSRDLLELSIAESGLDRMWCEIPETRKALINFAKHSGFKETGAGRPIKKGGELVPRVRLERKHGIRI